MDEGIGIADETLDKGDLPFFINVELFKILVQMVVPLESDFGLTVSGSFDFGEGQVIGV